MHNKCALLSSIYGAENMRSFLYEKALELIDATVPCKKGKLYTFGVCNYDTKEACVLTYEVTGLLKKDFKLVGMISSMGVYADAGVKDTYHHVMRDIVSGKKKAEPKQKSAPSKSKVSKDK